jgi:hypothetical protein
MLFMASVAGDLLFDQYECLLIRPGPGLGACLCLAHCLGSPF